MCVSGANLKYILLNLTGYNYVKLFICCLFFLYGQKQRAEAEAEIVAATSVTDCGNKIRSHIDCRPLNWIKIVLWQTLWYHQILYHCWNNWSNIISWWNLRFTPLIRVPEWITAALTRTLGTTKTKKWRKERCEEEEDRENAWASPAIFTSN